MASFVSDSAPFQYIESNLHGKVLNVERGQAIAGAHIILYSKNPAADSDKWSLQDAGNGYFHIVSKLDQNMVIDVEHGQAKEGAQLLLYNRKYPASNNQLFRWHGESIQSALGGDLVLDVEGANRADGTKAILWGHKEGNYVPNQTWRVNNNYP